MLKKAINCINPNLVNIYQKSIDVGQLSNKVLPLLPSHLQPHVNVASFEKGTLVLTYKNSSIANELRYLVPELRNALRQKAQLHQLAQIKLIQK